MEAVKPIRPMNIEFDSEKEEHEFARWAVTKDKSMSETTKRVRSNFNAYRQMKKRRK